MGACQGKAPPAAGDYDIDNEDLKIQTKNTTKEIVTATSSDVHPTTEKDAKKIL